MKDYTTQEAAKYLGCKPYTINYHVTAGRLNPIVRGHTRFFNKQQLDNLIASRRAYKPGHPTPPKAGKYTSAQIMKFLDVSRQRVSAIAQNRGWVLKGGYYEKKIVDEYYAQRLKKIS